MKYLLLIGGLLMQPLSAQPFTQNSSVNDILTQPTFQGFAERLLPWDDKSNEPNLQLNQIEQLMPYHSHISPQVVTTTLNKMLQRAEQGDTIFYEIYSEVEKRQDPSKQHTGIFVFKGKPNAPFAMIAPGGGFAYVGSLHEGFPIAQSIAEQGYNAFVVKYRAGMGGQIATEDMAQAVEFVQKNAKRLQVDPNGYSVWGASAGARMAAYIGSYGTQAFGTTQNSKPNSVIMLYTGHNDYNRQGEPATFVAIGEQDGIASPNVMKRRLEKLNEMGVPTEFHLYKNLGHGFALGTGTTAEGWEKQAVKFWQQQR
ncbi:alpha/beta hydrolase [Actinobacillus suis]|uniref:BD-FAE-like domain-containing protein n=3 Tax=Pasteurellaceae TaxID=712 RepID=K0FZB2_ACTSU|nr:alpha/beta hydrolase [Actinobacillus suis]AFU19907.1 hypothetical protein ASU2_08885 [Actinobacillus suis H91-0380]MCO4169429.1 alpha/beta hydrolase [Actinobacillus suis]MCQ9630178.1 alpha/beta hydrolase [Actinobacillus suis]MCQ9632511.1 alpha/beta hydrolase [Actinobacillus suis]MCQ9712003.1 alpha/beta hydrolase [Actinobacillus suis]